MYQITSHLKWFYICIVVTVYEQCALAKTFPSIVWNPYNPIFSCEEPTLRVHIDDIVSFVCPFYDVGFMTPPDEGDKPLYENMFLVNENAYKECNATGGRKVLLCNKFPASIFSFKMTFRSFSPTPSAFVFDEGKNYYFIGTGFREQQNVNSQVGGSCSKTQTTGIYKDYAQYKLRLKVYICKKDEECGKCTTSDCYSKGFTCPNAVCESWMQISSKPSQDFQSLTLNLTRSCSMNSQKYIESKQQNCLMNCSDWKISNTEIEQKPCMTILSSTKSDCIADLLRRTCKSSCGIDEDYCQFLGVACPTSGTPTAAARLGKKEDSDSTSLYIGICVGIGVILVVSIGFNIYLYRKRNVSQSKQNQISDTEEKGKVNFAYQSSVIERPESVYYTVDEKVTCNGLNEKPGA